VLTCGFTEGLEDDLSGYPGLSRDVQGVAGVVVEPGDDLHVCAGCAVGVGEAVVGDVGLPGFVGLVSFEPDVGGLGPFGRVGDDRAVAPEDPVDRGPRHSGLVAMLEVPVDGVRAGVQARFVELLTQPQHELDRLRRGCAGAGLRGA